MFTSDVRSSVWFVRDLYDSKTSIKCVPKYRIEEIIAQIVRKAEHLCLKFDAFLTIWAMFSINLYI